MSARAEIFANIRRALEVSGKEAPRRHSVEDRLDHAPQGIIPARGRGDATMRLAVFHDEAERVSASVTEVDTAGDVPAAIATYLRDRNLPARLRCGSDSYLAAMPW